MDKLVPAKGCKVKVGSSQEIKPSVQNFERTKLDKLEAVFCCCCCFVLFCFVLFFFPAHLSTDTASATMLLVPFRESLKSFSQQGFVQILGLQC